MGFFEKCLRKHFISSVDIRARSRCIYSFFFGREPYDFFFKFGGRRGSRLALEALGPRCHVWRDEVVEAGMARLNNARDAEDFPRSISRTSPKFYSRRQIPLTDAPTLHLTKLNWLKILYALQLPYYFVDSGLYENLSKMATTTAPPKYDFSRSASQFN